MTKKITVAITKPWLIEYLEEIKNRNGMSYKEVVENAVWDAKEKFAKQVNQVDDTILVYTHED